MADPSVRSYSPDPTLVSTVVMPASTQNLNSQQPQDGAATPTGADGEPTTQSNELGASRVPSIREGAEASTAEPAEDAVEPTQVPATPKVSITLLLVSGRRRTAEFEKQTTVGELKEIVWSTWPGGEQQSLPRWTSSVAFDGTSFRSLLRSTCFAHCLSLRQSGQTSYLLVPRSCAFYIWGVS